MLCDLFGFLVNLVNFFFKTWYCITFNLISVLTVVWVVKTRSIIIYSETRLGFLVIPDLFSGLVFLVIFVSWRNRAWFLGHTWLMVNQSSFPAVTWYTHSWTWLEKKLVTGFFFPSVFSSYDFERPRRKKRSKTFIH